MESDVADSSMYIMVQSFYKIDLFTDSDVKILSQPGTVLFNSGQFGVNQLSFCEFIYHFL